MSIANNCTFIGNLCRELEIKTIGNDTKVLENSVAITRKFKKTSGETVEQTDFIPFAVYGKAAETMKKWSKKGDSIALQGEMRLEQWEAQDGGKRSMLKLRVENFQFLNNKRD